ncbi:MAG TPA: hypothetical protein VGM97_03405 [Steroidobacteraceae bacterium]|jgi:hypothetical protein
MGGPLSISKTFRTVIRPSVTGRIIFSRALGIRDSLTCLHRLGKTLVVAMGNTPLHSVSQAKQDGPADYLSGRVGTG